MNHPGPRRFSLRHAFALLAVPALFLGAVPASARMPAATFLAKADALRRRGPLALFSADLKLLQVEAEAAGDELHAEHLAKVGRHERTDYCPPNRKLLGPHELIDGLHALPSAELRTLDIKQAMHAILVRNYPCK